MSVKYHEGKFPPTQLDWERLATPLERASTAVSRYDSFLGIIPDSSIMLAPMLVQEAVASSRMEGTHATVGDVLAYEAGDEFDSAKNDDVLEVVNYRRALHKSVEMLNDLPLSGRVLKSAHKILLHNVRGSFKSPGQYRNDQNWIGRSNKIEEAHYIPIPPEKLEDAMASWERFVNESSMPSLIKVSIAHAEFESIHPFKDGNGRIGRMLVPLMLNLDGLISHPCLYLSEFFEHRNSEYQDRLLAVSSDDLWTDWCVFFLSAIETQAKENDRKAHSIYDLYKDTLLRTMAKIKADGVEEAVSCLFRQAVFPSNIFMNKAGLSESTSRRLIKLLKDEELVIEIRPHRGSSPAILAFPRLLEITEDVTLA